MKHFVIAIDGYSSCGKSTMAKELAKQLGFIYIDSGAMYRAVALFALRQGWLRDGILDKGTLCEHLNELQISFCQSDNESKSLICLNGEIVEKEIRGLEVSNAVSIVAQVPEVREKMIDLQRHIAANAQVVMDGRDIGTVVFPDAELKIFVTADAAVRAQRRYDELLAKGENASLEDIRKNIEMRDHMDLNRPISPLRQAEDALVLDNGNMSIEEQNAWLLDKYHQLIK